MAKLQRIRKNNPAQALTALAAGRGDRAVLPRGRLGAGADTGGGRREGARALRSHHAARRRLCLRPAPAAPRASGTALLHGSHDDTGAGGGDLAAHASGGHLRERARTPPRAARRRLQRLHAPGPQGWAVSRWPWPPRSRWRTSSGARRSSRIARSRSATSAASETSSGSSRRSACARPVCALWSAHSSRCRTPSSRQCRSRASQSATRFSSGLVSACATRRARISSASSSPGSSRFCPSTRASIPTRRASASLGFASLRALRASAVVTSLGFASLRALRASAVVTSLGFASLRALRAC